MPYCITCNGIVGLTCLNPVECASELASCYGYDNEERVLAALFKAEHADWYERYEKALQTDQAPPVKDPDELPF